LFLGYELRRLPFILYQVFKNHREIMTIILGIDPGSRLTGYGVIKQEGRNFTYLGSGCI